MADAIPPAHTNHSSPLAMSAAAATAPVIDDNEERARANLSQFLPLGQSTVCSQAEHSRLQAPPLTATTTGIASGTATTTATARGTLFHDGVRVCNSIMAQWVSAPCDGACRSSAPMQQTFIR